MGGSQVQRPTQEKQTNKRTNKIIMHTNHLSCVPMRTSGSRAIFIYNVDTKLIAENVVLRYSLCFPFEWFEKIHFRLFSENVA